MREHDYQGVKSQRNEILRSEIFELEIEIVGGPHASYNILTERVW